MKLYSTSTNLDNSFVLNVEIMSANYKKYWMFKDKWEKSNEIIKSITINCFQ